VGGYGSGGWDWRSKRDTCERSSRLDLRWIRGQGYLQPGVTTFGVAWRVGDRPAGDIRVYVERDDDGRAAALELVYRYRSGGRDWRDACERVVLDWQACPYGGARAFMRCPACGRAVLVLYGVPLFRCRRCAGVVHGSTRENALDRADAKIRALRRRLGDPDPWRGAADGWRPRMKPGGMHWSTWWRLYGEWQELVDQWHAAFFADVERFARFAERIGARRR